MSAKLLSNLQNQVCALFLAAVLQLALRLALQPSQGRQPHEGHASLLKPTVTFPDFPS